MKAFQAGVERVSPNGTVGGRSDYSGRINLVVDYDEPAPTYHRCESELQRKPGNELWHQS